jgi:23S rRNA (cytidine1920-2'-O)/16S rRNA (cytidine1409-2'-O)-methyltransferase
MIKERLDQILFSRGLADSREKAKAMIMAGEVVINNLVKDKPGEKYPLDIELTIKSSSMKYVSRGGFKLEKALEYFSLNLIDKICMDVGASTGGFTDCMLQNGAKKVFSIDVGYGQLDWKLRNDNRVINMEKTNARLLDKSKIPDEIDFISIDVAFISLELILPPLVNILSNSGKIVALIKPQFEAGREHIGKHGVVRDPQIHKNVINKVIDFTRKIDLSPISLTFSPIKGPKGNIEYLLLIDKSKVNNDINTEEIVNNAHTELKNEV